MPSVVPAKVVAQARVNLLTAIHELEVAQMLFVLQPSLSMQLFGTEDQEPLPWQKPEEPIFTPTTLQIQPLNGGGPFEFSQKRT